MSSKKARTRCPKCHRRMSKPSDFEAFVAFEWRTVCLQCVREHFADPLLHLRTHKASQFRERALRKPSLNELVQEHNLLIAGHQLARLPARGMFTWK